MTSLVHKAHYSLNAMVIVLVAMCAGGCGESEPFSWSIDQAKQKKTLISELTIEPAEIIVDGKRIVFGQAWLEECQDGDYAICFRLEKGNDIFDKRPRPFFVIDDVRSGISERHGKDWLQFVEKIDNADISNTRASLINKWQDERQKNIRFIRKP